MHRDDLTPARVQILTLLAFLSGCCALAYEILYMRALTTLLGDMLFVHSALLSTFLVGIGLGAKLARRAVRWLWLLEILTGVYALALPVFLAWLSTQAVMVPLTAKPSLTILTTIALLSAPGLLVGFSIPLFSAYIKNIASSKLAFQSIYVAYNLGALISILAVEFVLVRSLGVRGALALVGGINVLNGTVLLIMRAAPRSLSTETPQRFPRRIVWALFLASLTSAVFQMLFFKLTYLIFGAHRENFAVGLSVTMFGIFLGAWLASKIRMNFVTLLASVPVWIGSIFLLFSPIIRLQQSSWGWWASSESGILAHKFLFGCILALGPMIAFGALLPALMRDEHEVAGESGHLLWVSSLANAAGYLGYVLIGHPFMTTSVLLAGLSVLTLLAALIAARFRLSNYQRAYAVAGVVLVIAMAVRWQEKNFYLAQWIDDLDPNAEIEVFKSGAESATLVKEDDDWWVSYNGHPSIEVQSGGDVNVAETLSGVIPALSAPRLGKALVLGLGTGITAGATASLFESTDVVEINNAFYEMMPKLAHANLNVGTNPAADLYLADGRSFLVGKERLYDAIVNSIPAPTYYSASKIYTVEFYQRVSGALKPDGVFCAWLSSWNMSEIGMEAVLSAIHHSFKYCDLRLMTRGYYMTTCANQPLEPRNFDELPATLDLADQLQQGLPDIELNEFFRATRISDNIFEHYEPSVPEENTDDHPVLEFMVVRGYQLGKMGEDPFVYRQKQMNIDPVRAHELGDAVAWVARAEVFHYLGADQFRTNFLPALRADPAVWELWQAAGFKDEVD